MKSKLLLIASLALTTLSAESITPSPSESWEYKIFEEKDGGSFNYKSNRLTRRITVKSDASFSSFDRGYRYRMAGCDINDTTPVFETYSFTKLHEGDSICDITASESHTVDLSLFAKFQTFEKNDTSLTLYKDIIVHGDTLTLYVKDFSDGPKQSEEIIWSDKLGLLSYHKVSPLSQRGTPSFATTLKQEITKKDGKAFDLAAVREAIANSDGQKVSITQSFVQSQMPVSISLSTNTLTLRASDAIQAVSLLSPTGRVLYTQRGTNITTIPLNSMAKGILFLQVTTEKGIATLPFVK